MNDISTTLSITPQEAQNGTTRTITLPDGRVTNITLAPGLYNGQIIQLPGHVPPLQPGGQPGLLNLTIQVQQGSGQYYQSGSNITPPPPFTSYTPTPTPPPASEMYGYTPTPSSTSPYPPQSPYEQPSPYAPVNPATNPQSGTYPYYPPPPVRPVKPSFDKRLIAIIGVVVVVLIGSIVLISVTSAQNTARQQGDATQLAQNQQTQTQQASGNATATGDAQSTATSQAYTQTQLAQATADAKDATATASSVNNATATANAVNPNPYLAGMGTLKYQDKLDGSNTDLWQTGSNCKFSDGAYHIKTSDPATLEECFLKGDSSLYASLKNFTIEFKMKVVSGDVGGVVFRVGNKKDYVLAFDTTSYCPIWRHNNTKDAPDELSKGYCSAFRQGAGQENTIGLVVQDSRIAWFVNGQASGAITDTAITDEGYLALFAGNYNTNTTGSTEASFRDFKLWT